MSSLTFQRKAGMVILRSSQNKILGIWKAHNDVTSGQQPWPDGKWPYDVYHAHAELSAPSTVTDPWSGKGLPRHTAGLGGFGIHLFKVKNAAGHRIDGLGIHAGRTQTPPTGSLNSLGTKTLGCIRVTPAAMLAINDAQFSSGDPILDLTVTP